MLDKEKLNNELLFKSMSGIDDKLIMRSETSTYKFSLRKKNLSGLLAASIGIIIGLIILLVALHTYGGSNSSMDGYKSTTDTVAPDETGYLPNSFFPEDFSPDSNYRFESGNDY